MMNRPRFAVMMNDVVVGVTDDVQDCAKFVYELFWDYDNSDIDDDIKYDSVEQFAIIDNKEYKYIMDCGSGINFIPYVKMYDGYKYTFDGWADDVGHVIPEDVINEICDIIENY